MKIKRQLPKLHFAASKYSLREAMQYVLLDFDKRVMVAIDGHILVVANMNEYIEDVEANDKWHTYGQWYIHKDQYKMLCKKDVLEIELNSISSYLLAIGKAKTQIDIKRSLDTKFPDYEVVIPEPNQKAAEEVMQVGLNVGVLNKLLSVFDQYDAIIFNPHEYGRAIRFEVRTQVNEYRTQEGHIDLAYGVIMPIHFKR